MRSKMVMDQGNWDTKFVGGNDIICCCDVKGEWVREPPSGCHWFQCCLSVWLVRDEKLPMSFQIARFVAGECLRLFQACTSLRGVYISLAVVTHIMHVAAVTQCSVAL